MPTAHYHLFRLAKETGRLVRGLLTGQNDKPLLNIEHKLWHTWEIATQRFQEQQYGRGGKRGKKK